MNLSLLEQNRDKLLLAMEDMDQRQLELQDRIALHQREAAEEIERIDSVDEERKREVPRLKHSISLYASTTGIKWDFLQDDILSGSVVRTACTTRTIVLFLAVTWDFRVVDSNIPLCATPGCSRSTRPQAFYHRPQRL